MKLVAATGGLGNQMFGYAFMLRLSKEHQAHLFHPYGDKSGRYGHAGFQLEQVFCLRPEDHQSHFGTELFGFYWHIIRILPKRMRQFMLKLVCQNEVKVAENFVFYPEVFHSTHKNEFFMGTWQSQRYFEGAEGDVRKAFTFNEDLLNEQTRQLADQLKQCNAVSIHVRRDDYLSTQYAPGFGGICTVAYYTAAIQYLKQREPDLRFFIFSDDITWCRENLNFANAMFVDWNKGVDSWQDMYLMCHCKHNIIANSTFSWWGGWLNANQKKIVVAPEKWWNGLKDDVVPDTWVRLSGN